MAKQTGGKSGEKAGTTSKPRPETQQDRSARNRSWSQQVADNNREWREQGAREEGGSREGWGL